MPRASRPRLERAVSAGSSEATEALGMIHQALPVLIRDMIDNGSPADRAVLLRLVESDLLRAQRGQADTVLQRVQAIRRQASETNIRIWNQAVKSMVAAGIELQAAEAATK